MRVGVYVGSFNPVHLGHISIVNYLLDNKILDKVIIVCTKDYWTKLNLLDIEHRLNMLDIYKSDSIIIDKTMNDIPYTYLILRKLKEQYDDISLIIGADNIINFDKWMEYRETKENNLIIINRDNIDISSYLKLYDINKYRIISDINISISSTKIRDLIKKKRYNLLSELLDERIIRYIKDNNLYME